MVNIAFKAVLSLAPNVKGHSPDTEGAATIVE